MTDAVIRRHGLEAFLVAQSPASRDDGDLRIQLQADLGHINLRGNPDSPAFLAAASSAVQQDLPVAANTMSLGEHRVYWLGPNEWQIVTATSNTQDIKTRLRESLAGQHASVSDLSGGQVALHISGPGALGVLAKGCTLDLHAGEFAVGSCAQSGLAKAGLLIGLIDDRPNFEIVVRRSFADYVARWLQHAAGEHIAGFSAT